MEKLWASRTVNIRLIAWLIIGLGGLSWLLLHNLAFLNSGLSINEVKAVSEPVGWHGIYHKPLYLPLKLIRSIIFVIFPTHGQLLSRLPNVIFGGFTVLTFAWLIRLWHSSRTAILASLLFATSAWVLHVSRLASFDVLYLWAIPTLQMVHFLLIKYANQPLVWYGSVLIWGLMLYIPGLVWLIGLEIYLQRKVLIAAFKHFTMIWQRGIYLFIGLIWLPLLIIDFTRPGQFKLWLGLPSHLAVPSEIIKHFAAVPVHLFIHGPQYPELWLARSPLLDIFTLAACLIGIYFYATHRHSGRSHLLALFASVCVVLVGFGGPVSLSLVVPMLYITASTGIAYLLHDWLVVFPQNPLARGLGIGLVSLAVALACVYNLRAYFVAWPHNATTKTTFSYHR